MVGAELGAEALEGLGGAADVADQEVGEDGARGVQGRRVRVVLAVPGVLERREEGRGVPRAEDEVALGLVGVVLVGVEEAGGVVELRVAGRVVAELRRPAGEPEARPSASWGKRGREKREGAEATAEAAAEAAAVGGQ